MSSDHTYLLAQSYVRRYLRQHHSVVLTEQQGEVAVKTVFFHLIGANAPEASPDQDQLLLGRSVGQKVVADLLVGEAEWMAYADEDTLCGGCDSPDIPVSEAGEPVCRHCGCLYE